MWSEIEARLAENEREQANPLRPMYLEALRTAGLRPGQGITKKMVSFELGNDDRLVWEIQNPRNFFVHTRWRPRIEATGLDCEIKRYVQGEKDGGRHSALSRDWSFGDADCLVVRVEDTSSLSKLLGILVGSSSELTLDPRAVARWIERLRYFFPQLERFDAPDPEFDAQERDYKVKIAQDLRSALNEARTDQDFVDAVHAALVGSNLLDWRTYWAMSPQGDADLSILGPGLKQLVQAANGPPESRPRALEDFVQLWSDAVPKGSADPARQIAEFVFMHLSPQDGIYIRHSVRQDFWKEGTGVTFPNHDSFAEIYRDELRFMRAVRQAFEAAGLAPRDMIDVQSALWVAHNYKDEGQPMISRESIEAAMDAFDQYQKSGEHAAVFDAFGDPRDYWVRSTRSRPNRVYPSKPIVGFLRNSTNLNGGWGQKHDAAALLHNAGFIIVGNGDLPVAPPESSEHLIQGADRIRLCAQNYYVEPARENRRLEVSIRAGDLARDMDLRDSFPAICSALGGKKFLDLAGLSEPTSTSPNPSSSTIFTYQLNPLEGQATMATEANRHASQTTNLILYGPPGTGKTYATALEAVRLCLGDEAVAPFNSDRAALMSEYRRLCGEGRIEFVTFHQSFSYEEFVEGLRPTTNGEPVDDEERESTSGGFELKPHAGLFKRISERARLDTGEAPGIRLDRSRPIYKVALGVRHEQENRIQEGLENNLIHIGWGGTIDWSDERFDDFEEIKEKWNDDQDTSATGKNPNIEITFAFRSGMQVGDYVVISDGRDSFRAFGRVTGEYFFDHDAEFHPHRRAVEWLWRDDAGADRALFYDRNFRRQTAYRLDPERIDWDALEQVVFGVDAERPIEGARPHVLIIDEINRANISKVFGELITLLEVDKRLGCDNEIKVRLPYSGVRFGVPANLHIIATMNTADRSIALLDTALRRRFEFRELMPDTNALSAALAAKGLDATNVDGINLVSMMHTLNERIEYLFDREHQIGHAYFTSCESRADIEATMRNKVIPLLAEYFYEDWSKVAAVLGDANAGNNSHFLETSSLTMPPGLGDDEFGENKVRWNLKSQFDFSEFGA